MNNFMIAGIVIGTLYVIGGFVYAGANAMIDLNWLVKFYRSFKP